MIQISESEMRDVKAGIAAGIADLSEKGQRIKAVAGTLRVDEPEARRPILRGRQIQKAKAA